MRYLHSSNVYGNFEFGDTHSGSAINAVFAVELKIPASYLQTLQAPQKAKRPATIRQRRLIRLLHYADLCNNLNHIQSVCDTLGETDHNDSLL
jgi:hypothetical protein